MKNLKRCLAVLLALLMCLSAVPALAAPGSVTLRAPYTATDENNSYFTSVIARDGVFYFTRADGQVYTCPADGETLTPYLTAYPQYLENEEEAAGDDHYFMMTENGPYAYNFRRGVLLKLSVAADGTATADQVINRGLDEDLMYIDTDSDTVYAYPFEQTSQAVVGNELFMMLTNYYDTGDGLPHMFSINLDTGEKTAYPVENVQYIAPYKDGKLLCLVFDRERLYSEDDTFTMNFSLFDPSTGEITLLKELDPEIYTYNMGGIAYDAASDTLYLVVGQKVYRWVNTGDGELCAYSPLSYYYCGSMGSCCAIAGGTIAFAGSTEGTFLRSLAPANLPAETLNIYQGFADEAHRKAAAALGDVAITLSEDTYYSSAQDLAQAMVSGGDEFDILRLNVNYLDFTRLMEKGYCEDLSSSQIISDFFSSTYDVVQNAMSLDGKVYGVPVMVDINCFGSYMDKEDLNAFLTESGIEVPKTYLEWMQLLNDWGEKGYYETYSDYVPTNNGNPAEGLLSNVLIAYFQYMEATKQELTLDTPLLRTLLTAVKDVDISDWYEEPDWDDEEAMDEFFSRESLFDDYVGLDVQKTSWSSVFPLSLSDETEPVIPLNMEILFINPRSQHKEAAIRYLEAYVQALDVYTKTKLCPGMNDPIENEYYESNLQSMQENLDSLNKQLEKAAEEDVKETLRQEIADREEYMATYAAEERYYATAESIAAYRALDKYFFVPAQDSNIYASEETRTLINQYRQGLISMDQFIQQMDAKLRLMRLENQ